MARGMQAFLLSVPVTHTAGGPWGSSPPRGLPSPDLRSPAHGASHLCSGYMFIMTYCTGHQDRGAGICANEPDVCKQNKPLS